MEIQQENKKRLTLPAGASYQWVQHRKTNLNGVSR